MAYRQAMDIAPLATAVDRARAFAASLPAGAVIDEATGFTADNLLALIAAAAPPTKEDVIVDQLGDLA
jgi:hypothetical protein